MTRPTTADTATAAVERVLQERERAPLLAHLVDQHAATIGRVAKLVDALRQEASAPPGTYEDGVATVLREVAGRIDAALNPESTTPTAEEKPAGCSCDDPACVAEASVREADASGAPHHDTCGDTCHRDCQWNAARRTAHTRLRGTNGGT